ncbi:hypothetical protein [Celeribacter indicus]|uniref:Putative two-component response regulator n=1 Tax=Celeribacter indicus TaxID=1208324 RepID=A0A0B5DWP0_9RHOB|nr:hypothetical protein [Celeribacter indicus]AJE45550.1 putative two-component response regulator [Celeribacter indicus]
MAERLAAAGVPFALATGYGADGDPVTAYPRREIVQKPFSESAIREAMARAFSA